MGLGEGNVDVRFLRQIMLVFSWGIGEDGGMNAFASSGMKSVSRREILRALGATAALAVLPTLRAATAEKDSLPMQFYKSLTEEQRAEICLPVDHPKRQFVSNWWYICPGAAAPHFLHEGSAGSREADLRVAAFAGASREDELAGAEGPHGRHQEHALGRFLRHAGGQGFRVHLHGAPCHAALQCAYGQGARLRRRADLLREFRQGVPRDEGSRGQSVLVSGAALQ